MLTITIPKGQLWDKKNRKFIYTKETVLSLEHSLIAISKWESKYHKPFIGTKKSESETRYYIKCMTINNVKDDKVYWVLTAENIAEIDKYIKDPMTATVIHPKKDDKPKKKPRPLTSEYIYYLMIQFGIPYEFEKWHIQRLLTLINLSDEENSKNNPDKKEEKKSSKAMLDDFAALNERRLAESHKKG